MNAMANLPDVPDGSTPDGNTPVGNSGADRFDWAMVALGALFGLSGVVIGAWAAHWVADGASSVATAGLYALIHGVAMAALATARMRCPRNQKAARILLAAGTIALGAGIAMFSGAITAGQWGIYPGTAPYGGMSLMAGWLLAAAGAIRMAVRG